MANKYLHASGGSGNWSDGTGTWTTTDQGSTVTSAPTSADVAIMTVNAGARVLTMDGSQTVSQINCAGFTGTLQANSTAVVLSVTTNITFSSTMSYGATAWRLKEGSGTATISIANTFPYDFEWAATGTKTLAANVTIGGITYLSDSPTVNSYVWYAVGGVESTSATGRTFYGSTELWIQGGRWYYIIKRTGGKVVVDGNVTIEAPTTSAQSLGLYDSTLKYNSGTATVVGDTLFSINGTSTIESNVGSNIVFENIEASGTTTINSDIYVAHSLQIAGTVTWTVNGAYTIHLGYGGGTGHLIMYNLGTVISSTATISMEGTGTVFRKTSLNGMQFEAVNPLQCSLTINSSGTVTFEPITTKNKFGGGRTLSRITGTVVTTGCTFNIPASHSYYIGSDFTFPTIEISESSGGTGLYISSGVNVACTKYIQGYSSFLSPSSGSSLTVATSLYINGKSGVTTWIGGSDFNLIYQGTFANCVIYLARMQNVNASSSSVPIYIWQPIATLSGNTNVYGVTGVNIGGAGISITEY